MPATGGAVFSEAEIAEVRRILVLAVARVCPATLARHSEDMVQEALLRVLDHPEAIKDPEIRARYLKRVAYCAVVDEIRRWRRKGEVPIPGDVELGPTTSPRPLDPLAELGSAVFHCLGRLVPPRRRAVALHLMGNSVQEIAKLLEWPTKRADNLVYRGLADLRSCLTGKGFKP